ncbi:cyclic nucleotide-binding domain-containing protein [Desulfoplanes sp.]
MPMYTTTPDMDSSSMPTIASFQRGETVFTAGESADRFYILLGGSVALARDDQPTIHITGRHAFGIEGIITPSGVYPCTATALEPSRMAMYTADLVDEMLHNSPRTTQLVLQGLSHVLEASWSRLDNQNDGQAKTQFVGRIQTAGPGQWIMQDGEMSTEIYRIISTDKGLEVVKNGNRLAVIHEPGEIFGEMSCLLNEGRTAGIRSLGNSVLEVYTPEQLRAMLADYPDFSIRLVTTLAQRLARTSQELAGVKGRIG